MPQTDLARAAQRHATLRWVGVPLFGFGLLGLVTALGLILTRDAAWSGMMLYIAASGLSLATFGTHNDTALALAQRAAPEAGLPEALRRELEEELERDRQEVIGLSPSPRAALAVTMIALTLHVFGLRWILLSA